MELPNIKRLPDITRLELVNLRSLEFMKWLACYSETRGSRTRASELYLHDHPTAHGVSYVKRDMELTQAGAELASKALTPPATTTSAAYAGALVGVDLLAQGFVAQVFSASLLGRLPNVRKLPFQVRIPSETAGANFQWVSENTPKPSSTLAFATGVTLTRLKAAAICVFTVELLRGITETGAETLRDTLKNGLVAFTDKSFLDPTSTAIAGQRPASITAGLTPVTPGADFAASMQALMNAFFSARPGAVEPVLIAAPQQAAAIRSLNAGGGVGLPIVTTAAAGTSVVMVDGAGVFYADDGVEIHVSGEATFEMADPATSPPTATTVHRSLWQDNLRGFRVERFVNWYALPNCVQYLA